MSYNAEKRTWRGRSYRKGGKLVRDLRSREVIDNGTEPLPTVDAAPLAKFTVVEETDHLPPRHHECDGMAEAMSTLESLYEDWSWDDRLVGISILDAAGVRVYPSMD